MIEAALFDLGDTLIHFAPGKRRKALEDLSRALYEQLIAAGRKPPAFPAYFRAMTFHLGLAYLWSQITRREVKLAQALQVAHRRLGIDLDMQQTTDLGIESLVAVIRRFFTIDADAKNVVTQLHDADFKLGLVSNTILPGYTVDEYLQLGGLLDCFPVRIYSSEVGYMKPSRKIFRLALDQLGVSADRTVFVGDHVLNDLRGAKRMGMRTVLAAPDGRAPRFWGRPDHVIRSLTELPVILGLPAT